MAIKLLGIDYGSVRVGLALAEAPAPPHRLATLPNDAQLIETLHQLIADHQVDKVVVGLPRGLDGQETAQTKAAREFAESLGHEVVLQDEAGTSSAARDRLGKQVERQPELIDQEAAAIMLEDYLRG